MSRATQLGGNSTRIGVYACLTPRILLLRSLTLKKKKIYLFIFRERGREGEREGEKHQSVASHTCPNQELNPQSRHVP